jgi:aminomethyltransferase
MSAALLRTPLFDAHLKAGARLVDFGGWEMPVNYGSQIEEHHAVRNAAGMFDVSHMRSVDVTGPQAMPFLRRLLANDVIRLNTPGQALYSCMLNPEGGVIDDLIVYFFGQEDWRLVINAGCADKDIAWMRRVADAGAFDVNILSRDDLSMLALQGPLAPEKLAAARPAFASAATALKAFHAQRFGETTVARTGYTGEDGFEIMLPAQEVQQLWDDLLLAGVAPCGLGARDTLRLEAGMNLYGQDMDALVLPAQAGLSWTVSLKDADREFIGRAAITAFPAKQKMVGLVLQAKGVMRAHMKVLTAAGDGEVTSGTMSPTMGVSIAMARVPETVEVGDQVSVQIRGNVVPAKVCALPFVRRGKVLVSLN